LTGAAILGRAVGAMGAGNGRRVASERVQVTVTASDLTIGLGNRVLLGVQLQMPAGSHVYGPGVGNGYHGIAWQMNDSSCWYQSDAAYPEPQMRPFPFAEGMLPVYVDTLRLTRELVLKPVLSATEPSLYRLFKSVCLDASNGVKASGVLRLQVCDERQCYPPQTIPLEWKFRFVAPDMERSPAELRREFEAKF